MSTYNIVPGVDDQHNFPPEVRRKLAATTEMSDVFLALANVPTVLGANPTVVAAAVAAVTAATTGQGFVAASDTRLGNFAASETGYAYIIADPNGGIAFGITNDGTVVPTKIILPSTVAIPPGVVTTSSFASDALARTVPSTIGPLMQDFSTESGYVFGVADVNGSIAFAVKNDGSLVGRFTITTGSVLYSSLSSDVQSRLTDSGIGSQFSQLAEDGGYVFSINDSNGASAFAIRKDGTIKGTIDKALALAGPIPAPTDIVTTKLDGSSLRQLYRTKVAGGKVTQLTTTGDNHTPIITSDGKVLFRQIISGVTTDKLVSLSGGPVYAAASLMDNVRCFGDSLTQGVGGSGGGWPTRLATLLGIPTSNYGFGGQTSPQIASRQGGNAALLLAGITIPNDTSSVALNVGIDILFLSGNPTRTNTVSISGISGTLTRAAGAFSNTATYSFSRTVAGSSTVVASGTPIIVQSASDSEQSVQIFWSGRNDLSLGQGLAGVATAVDQMIAYQKNYAKKYLIIGTTGSVSEIAGSTNYTLMNAVNAANATKYGDSFIDINRYLITNGLADAGITPTTQDTTDITNDTIPTSLHYSDGLHFNDAAYQVIAQQVYNRIISKGWLL